MVGFILSILKSKSSILIDIVLGIALVSLVSFGYYRYKKQSNDLIYATKEIQHQKNAVASLKLLNTQNIKANKNLIIKYDSTIALLRQKAIKDVQRVKTITIIKERIKYVSKKDDGSVAPILTATLRRLQQLQARDNNSSKDSSTKSQDTETVVGD